MKKACLTLLLVCYAVFAGCAKNPDGTYPTAVGGIWDSWFNKPEPSLLDPPKDRQDASLISQGKYQCQGEYSHVDFTIRKSLAARTPGL